VGVGDATQVHLTLQLNKPNSAILTETNFKEGRSEKKSHLSVLGLSQGDYHISLQRNVGSGERL